MHFILDLLAKTSQKIDFKDFTGQLDKKQEKK